MFCYNLKRHWQVLVLLLTPLLLLPIPLIYASPEGRCLYGVLLMATYWITEVLPLPVTAFLPTFLFPLLGVMTASEAAAPYLNHSNFLFIGGLIVALGVEEVNLHRRLALRVLLLMGSDAMWLMFGFMLTTWFLSMWLSNTATTAMMLPIALAVLDEILRVRHGDTNALSSGNTMEMKPRQGQQHTQVRFSDPEVLKSLPERDQSLAKALLLCLCYAANIGGTGTLTGTVPNVIALGQLQEYAKKNGNMSSGLTYANWMGSQVPFSLLLLSLAWVLLCIIFMPREVIQSVKSRLRQKQTTDVRDTKVQDVLRQSYREMGTMKFGEWSVLTVFTLLVLLWILRDPRFMPGWASLFPAGHMKDSVPSMFMACLLFAVPHNIPRWASTITNEQQKTGPILTWSIMQARFPWGVIVLLGGGFAMAAAVQTSGLDMAIGSFLRQNLVSLPSTAFCCIAVLVVTFLTEVTSNTATATIFVPILLTLASSLAIHPFYLVIPVSVACSFAFMLPVATPPNAIVFGAGILRVHDMMKTGFTLNLIAAATALLNINTWSHWLFGLDEFPQWANVTIPVAI